MNKLECVIDDAISRGLFPGCAVGIWSDGAERLFSMGDNSGEDRLWDLASLTKIKIFTAVLCLVEQGRLSLDDKIVRFVPFEQPGDIQKMTVRHLLTCSLDFVMKNELHARAANGDLLFYKEATLARPLGTMFRYGNPSAFIAGELPKVVMGEQDLQLILEEFVFRPLGMKDTSYDTVDPDRLRRVVPTWEVRSNILQWGVPQDPTSQKLGFHSGIAGLFSNIRDMLAFNRFLVTGRDASGGQLLPTLWREMHTNQHEGIEYADGFHRYAMGIDMMPKGYADGNVSHEHSVLMSGSSGPFTFACTKEKLGAVILLASNQTIPGLKVLLKEFRRQFTSAVIAEYL